MVVERNGLTHDIGTSAVLFLPERVTQHRRPWASARVVRHRERAPDHRVKPESVEKLSRHIVGIGVSNLAARREIKLPAPVNEDPGEDVLPVANLLPDRIRIVIVHAASDLEQLLRMTNRQRLQHHGIDQAEDRSVGADPQRKRKDRHGGEAGRGPKSSKRVAEVLEQHVLIMPSRRRRQQNLILQRRGKVSGRRHLVKWH